MSINSSPGVLPRGGSSIKNINLNKTRYFFTVYIKDNYLLSNNTCYLYNCTILTDGLVY